MPRPALALLLLAAACGNTDNQVSGGIAGSATTPLIVFDTINSAISGEVTLSDPAGNPIGPKVAVVVLSTRPALCDVLKAHPDYFRKPPEGYLALILFTPLGRLGTFFVDSGRASDQGTAAEIVAASGPQSTVTPLTAYGAGASYISLSDWENNPGGQARGNFYLVFNDPQGTSTPHLFTGRFKTGFCPTMEGTLLP
jgi:hypothetical protein